MKDLFGDETIVEQEELEQKEPKWLFLFLDDLRKHKKNILTEDNESKYNPYMINRFLMMDNPSNCLLANDMNIRCFLPKRMQHDYYLSAIRKTNSFARYTKVPKEEYLDIVKEYFGYGDAKARVAMKILDNDDISYMKSKLNKGELHGSKKRKSKKS